MHISGNRDDEQGVTPGPDLSKAGSMTSSLPDKIQLRHRMRTIRAEAAARDPDAAEKIADLFPMKLLERYGPVVSG